MKEGWIIAGKVNGIRDGIIFRIRGIKACYFGGGKTKTKKEMKKNWGGAKGNGRRATKAKWEIREGMSRYDWAGGRWEERIWEISLSLPQRKRRELQGKGSGVNLSWEGGGSSCSWALCTAARCDAAHRAEGSCTDTVGRFAKETCPFSSQRACERFSVFASVQDIRQLAKEMSFFGQMLLSPKIYSVLWMDISLSQICQRWSGKRSWAWFSYSLKPPEASPYLIRRIISPLPLFIHCPHLVSWLPIKKLFSNKSLTWILICLDILAEVKWVGVS